MGEPLAEHLGACLAFAFGDDSVRLGGEVEPGELKPPTQVDVLADAKALVESADGFEGTTAHSEVGCQPCGQVPDLASHSGARDTGLSTVQRTQFECARRYVGSFQRARHGLEPARLYDVVRVTERE